MAKTSPVYARIDTQLKDHAESILSKLGITPSGAIQMLYSQIVLRGGMPFDLRIPTPAPIAAGSLSRAELSSELSNGMESLKSGKGISADAVDKILAEEFGI